MTVIIDEIIETLERGGAQRYGGEAVSQLQHALQCARLAEEAGADDDLIVAALLHDFGHLTHELGEDCAQHGVDDAHEHRAERLLASYFPAAVVAPIRFHVDAKRYLCAVEPDYHAALSLASRHSLALQGGPFADAAAAAFAAGPHAEAAVALRRWDDLAKDPAVATPPLEHYRPHLERCLLTVRT